MKKFVSTVLCLALLFSFAPTSFAENVNLMKVPNADPQYGNLSEVRIAVIDTGFSGTSEAFDLDRVGAGGNYVIPEDGTEDRIGHGTKLTSLILGSSDGTLRCIAPGATVIPLVYYTVDEFGNTVKGDGMALAKAIRDAIDVYSCHIINISSGITEDLPSLREAISYAESRGVPVIASVGNDGFDNVTYYPAGYDSVIGVGSVDKNGIISHFSQRNYSVTVCALGEELTVRCSDGSFTEDSGSSYAAAYVSAFAARLMGQYPQLNSAVFRELISLTCTDAGSRGYDSSYGYGIINMTAGEEYARDYYEDLGYADIIEPFYDVSDEAWYRQAVLYTYGCGFFNGVAPGVFDPDGVTTRAMAITALHRFHSKFTLTEEKYGPHGFTDCAPDGYYDGALRWARAEGIVLGRDSEHFCPDESVTRLEMAYMLHRYISAYCPELLASSAGKNNEFEDMPKDCIEVEELVRVGLFIGDGKRLFLSDTLTRAQYAQLVFRVTVWYMGGII